MTSLQFLFFFPESSHVAYKSQGNETHDSLQPNILPWTGFKGQDFFSSDSSHVAYQMNRKVVIYTMGRLGEWCFLQSGRGLIYCISIRHALVFFFFSFHNHDNVLRTIRFRDLGNSL